LEEYAPGGVLAATFIRGIDLLFEDQAGTLSYYATDDLGSTRALTTSAGSLADTDNYDAYGNLIASTGATFNPYLFAGMQFDAPIGKYYDRARDYSSPVGQFDQRDTDLGDISDPLTLNSYAYAAANPSTYVDLDGHDFTIASLTAVAIDIGIAAGIGAAIGAGATVAANYALGNSLGLGVWQGALTGAILGAGSAFSSTFALATAGYGLYTSGNLLQTVNANPNSRLDQQVVAFALFGLAVYGGYTTARNFEVNGFWSRSGSTSPATEAEVSAGAQGSQLQPPVRNIPRLARDASVGPNPPPANFGTGPNGTAAAIGKNTLQTLALTSWLNKLNQLGATDIRVNQQQVNYNGTRVGTNRPDLQFNYAGQRYYIEWDSPGSSRGMPHAERIRANDPSGVILIYQL
jgi:RHS repeat-associated protein